MCHPKPCRTCGKTTWAGCGQHVGQVRAMIPADQWCDGHSDEGGDGFFRRLLGR
ncbi:MAG TPA: hypothetical protein VNS55_13620 [Nocardioides sp.]|nr:hypothetical protein [Nocardioides sp.]